MSFEAKVYELRNGFSDIRENGSKCWLDYLEIEFEKLLKGYNFNKNSNFSKHFFTSFLEAFRQIFYHVIFLE